MSLRIGCDLDGVLADMDSALARHAAMLFGGDQPDAGEPDAISADSLPAVTLNLTARQQRLLWQHVRSVKDFWETLHEIESGAVARLADLAAAMRWEVIFLTKRPDTDGRTAQVQSQRWLETNGFPLPSVFVVRGSRGRIASALALDVVVDDRLENCLDVMVDSKSRSILVSRDENAQLPASARRLGIGVVRSVAECLDILSDAAAMRGERETVLTRLMRTLGF
jgi:hypothetical protein